MSKNFKKKLELTAPAGGMEQLTAAVNAGADSVYIGYKKFGARAYAENFDLNQIKRAVEYAHDKNVKIYLTLNTLIKDSEIEEVIRFLIQYLNICNDGIIIQDFCIYKIIKDLFGGSILLHASTQLNIHNSYSLKFLSKLRFKRVIPAREMTLEEIRGLCGNELPEIEIFVHGSQCYSYSGSCYFSSFISGRSGNRGKCTQPCRMKYRLLEEMDEKHRYIRGGDGYIFSKNDLCLLEFIPEIARAGVSALKIEGRMKSAEYVGIITSIYRKYIDLYYSNPSGYKVNEYDYYKISQIFSRELGEGYIKNKYPREVISIRKSGSIGNFIGRVYRVDYKKTGYKKIEKIYIKSRWEINSGDIIEIWTKKGNSRITVKNLELLDKKNNRYKYMIKADKKDSILGKDRVFKYFDKKISDEAYELYNTGHGKKNSTGLKIKDYSESRCKMDEKEIKKYINKFFNNKKQQSRNRSGENLKLSARIYNRDLLNFSADSGAENIIYSNFKEIVSSKGPETKTIDMLEEYTRTGSAVTWIDTPHILYDNDFNLLKNNLLKLLERGIKYFRVSNLAVLEFLTELNKKGGLKINICAGSGLNLFNTPAVGFFYELMSKSRVVLGEIELSPELNLKEISGIITNMLSDKSVSSSSRPGISIFGHGFVKIMNSRYKLKYITGKESTAELYIEDKKGFKFPIISDYNGNMVVFNSKKICTIFDLEKINNSGVNNLIIDSRFYSKKDFFKILKSYRKALNMLYDKKVKKYRKFISYLQGDNLFSDYSRGHLFRGVE